MFAFPRTPKGGIQCKLGQANKVKVHSQNI